MIKPEDDIDTDFDSEIEEYLSSGVMGRSAVMGRHLVLSEK